MSIVLCCHYAGLGNKLFEIACAYSLSQKLNKEFSIMNMYLNDPHNNFQTNDWLIKRFNINCDDFTNFSEKGYTLVTEQESLCCSLDFNVITNVCKNKHVLLRGYFQTDKYFKAYKNDLLRLFRCPDDVQQQINSMDFNTHSFFLHIRLGDYLHNRHHFVNLSNYYETCLNKIFDQDSRSIVYVFSNDVENIFVVYPILKKFNLKIVRESNQVISLFLMASCSRGGVCANSTFSWWGSYLNPNPDKLVFMPSIWFNPNDKLSHINTNDIYYDGVEVVTV